MADIPDGVLQVMESSIRLLSGPDLTLDILRSIKTPIEDLREGRITQKQAAAAVATVHPGLGKIVRDWGSFASNIIMAFATAMIALIAWREHEFSNRAAEDIAVEAFESVYLQPQPEIPQRSFTNRPIETPGNSHRDLRSVTGDGKAKLNRSQRRAAAAKDRAKRRRG